MKLRQLALLVVAIAFLAGVTLWTRNGRPGAQADEKPAGKASATARKMIDAAKELLAALTPEQKAKTAFAFDDPVRVRWHYYPVTPWPRQGATIKEMDAKQRELFKKLLRSGTSERGYATVLEVMALDGILRDIENTPWAKKFRDSELYHVCVFGTPGATGKWGWRIEGHHLNLNYVIADGQIVSSTPSVFGANPAVVLSGPYQGLRALGKDEDMARRLFTELEPTSRKKATLAEQGPFDVLSEVKPRPKPLPLEGVPFASLDPAQQKELLDVITQYAGKHPPDVEQRMLEEVTAGGLDKTHFGWAGSAYPGEPFYFRVHNPNFIIEFCNTQAQGNHIHAVWRSYKSDFALPVQ